MNKGATLLRKCLRSVASRLPWIFTLVLSVAGAPAALAHALDIAQFEVEYRQGNAMSNWQVDVVLPRGLDPAAPITVPADCSLTRETPRQTAAGHVLAFGVACPAGETPEVQTRWGRDGSIVNIAGADGERVSTMVPGAALGTVLTLAVPGSGETQTGFWQTAWRYLVLGTEHVLIGWDHLAFVFCLTMLASGTALLWLVSAFTIGHSISLACSYLGLVAIPIAPVEAVIALSIVYMAREAYLNKAVTGGLTPQQRRRQTLVTGAFGLVHGLGFASVLGDLGVSTADTVTALAFFNVGVEVGQLLFIACVLMLMTLFGSLALRRAVMKICLCVAGGMGMFWTLQRIAGL